ncbi:MAG: phage holin family protein [Sphingomonadales bacterium]|nr:phage holin family protein [Sphingomonadales bacterium]
MTGHDDTDGAEGPGREGKPLDGGVTTLVAEARRLADDARTYASAEVAFQLARARVVGLGARNLALYGLFAVVFVIFALGALTIGLLIALTPLVTAWGATAIVVGLLALGALLCLRGALRGWRRITRAVAGTDAEPAEPRP